MQWNVVNHDWRVEFPGRRSRPDLDGLAMPMRRMKVDLVAHAEHVPANSLAAANRETPQVAEDIAVDVVHMSYVSGRFAACISRQRDTAKRKEYQRCRASALPSFPVRAEMDGTGIWSRRNCRNVVMRLSLWICLR